MPSAGAVTTCSIFMDSMTAMISPAATSVPLPATDTIVPTSVEGTPIEPAAPTGEHYLRPFRTFRRRHRLHRAWSGR